MTNKIIGTSDMKRIKDLKGNPLLLFVHEWAVQSVWIRIKALSCPSSAAGRLYHKKEKSPIENNAHPHETFSMGDVSSLSAWLSERPNANNHANSLFQLISHQCPNNSCPVPV